MSRTRVSIGIAVSCAAVWALVTAYHIDPKTAAMSGWTSHQAPNNRVSEILTVNFGINGDTIHFRSPKRVNGAE